MKKDFTVINVIIDASGSMEALTKDTLGGFNTFLKEQKALPGEARLTLCTFDTVPKVIHEFANIKTVKPLTAKQYSPSGMTALLDALGQIIENTGKTLYAMSEDEKPQNVIVVVITDGQENSSKKFDRAKIAEMVKHQQDVYNWQFLFFGANIDAFTEGKSLGLSPASIQQYNANSSGVGNVYRSVSDSVTKSRTTP